MGGMLGFVSVHGAGKADGKEKSRCQPLRALSGLSMRSQCASAGVLRQSRRAGNLVFAPAFTVRKRRRDKAK